MTPRASRYRRTLELTLDPVELAALGATPSRTVGALARAYAAGDVSNLEKHLANTDNARDAAVSSSTSKAAQARHGQTMKQPKTKATKKK